MEQGYIDIERFRALLGSYPTGVAVVTGLDAAGQPLGMVVGTFTSVSLEPPLVAFLQMKSSRTFNSLRDASKRFCVNILAADQEAVCRVLATSVHDKFAGIAWRKSPAGNPVIDGVVAWIDCDFHNVVDAGDHDIVLGAVQAMGLERDALPLLFFQRGYGRFSSGSLVPVNEREVLWQVRLAEAARVQMDALAAELDVGCSLIASAGAESIYVAVADRPGSPQGQSRLGTRAPLVPPLGALFVGGAGGMSEDAWLGRLGKGSAEAAAKAREQLARVSRRGWSISLLGGLSPQELDLAIDLYSCTHRTPEQERRFYSTVNAMFDRHEPEDIAEDEAYDVLHLSFPVRRSSGATLFILRISDLPAGLTGAQIGNLVERLRIAASDVESAIAGIPER